uniref:Uperin-5.1 n=1 Tax=Uperoleia inundata TaxID=104953 RepID=UPE51_UPEIN|nr:RecName: Full=Uperin-5.1 [Uperoleia inundata]
FQFVNPSDIVFGS